MRIIAGKLKGRRLVTIKGLEVRPTSDRVKEAVFRILGERVIGADFLDLCAGTGSIGLEALSRGAKSVTFIERDYHCIRVIESNLEQCGFHPKHPQVQLIKREARKGLADLGTRNARFHLIYFDPPYDAGIHGACLGQIDRERLLTQDGLMIVEHRRVHTDFRLPKSLRLRKSDTDPPLPVKSGELILNRQEQYGDTMLSFYEWEFFTETSEV